jgi:hypothetical protein
VSTTPKRRPKEQISGTTEKALKIEHNSFIDFQDSVKKSDICTSSGCDNEIAARCIAKYGLDTFMCALSANQHVPVLFYDRMRYIINIIKEVNSQLNDNKIIDLVNAVSCIKSDWSMDESNFKKILWKASFKHKEPYLNFIVPKVTQCIWNECKGNVYPKCKSGVTLYKMTGPEPALKSTLRCRSCSIHYNVNFFTVPNVGRKLYTGNNVSDLKNSSTWSYFSQYAFEFMCESG